MQSTAGRIEPPAGELVRRAQRGDSAAFEELIRRYERIALSVAYGVLNSAVEAGDVVQEAFLRAWQRLADLNEPDKFGPWVCGIVRNFALDLRRRARNAPVSSDTSGNALATGAVLRLVADDPVEELGRQEGRQQVRLALRSLDEISRSAVVMRYYDGRSSKEIGEILGLAPAAVDMRLSRARRQLKELLEKGLSSGSEPELEPEPAAVPDMGDEIGL